MESAKNLIAASSILLLLATGQAHATVTVLDCYNQNNVRTQRITLDDLSGTVSIYFPVTESTSYYYANFTPNEVLFEDKPAQATVGTVTVNNSVNRINLKYHVVSFINGAPGGDVWFQCKIAPKETSRRF